MKLLINGQARLFPQLNAGATVEDLLNALALKADRIAVEHNGSIVSRTGWATTAISDGDQFEIVHFVGGGSTRRLTPKLVVATPLHNTDFRTDHPVTAGL